MTKERSDSDPVSYGDFVALRVEVERRLTAVETRVNNMKEDITELKASVEKLSGKIDDVKESVNAYRKYIVVSLLGGTTVVGLLTYLLRILLGM